jgi:hypothetical protein
MRHFGCAQIEMQNKRLAEDRSKFKHAQMNNKPGRLQPPCWWRKTSRRSKSWSRQRWLSEQHVNNK